MRILVASDAWYPQVNGVVRTYERLAQELPKLGAEVSFLVPSRFRTLPCPTYPEIRLSLVGPRAIARYVEEVRPDFIHIATEGPIGLMMRRYCRKMKRPFTTSYHTRFPEYVSARLPIPESWGYSFQRRFHNGAAAIFVATPSVEADLKARGFERMMRWTRGVDVDLFRPRNVRLFGEQPVFLYVGRVAVEKNVKAFLDLDLPGRKVVVGSGPQAAELARRYPDVLFTGPKEGEELAEAYASADVFVFPSLYRHVRSRASRSFGLRRSGGCLPRIRAEGRAHRPGRGRPRFRPPGGCLEGSDARPRSGAGPCPELQLGEFGQGVRRERAGGA